MDPINNAFTVFKTLTSDYERLKSQDISESDTRSKLIDKIFIEILGWNEMDIEREGHGEGGFYDYRFYSGRVQFVVEAKRNFHQLKLPNNHKFTTLNVLYKENKEVIDQIRKYLFDQSLQVGVITNGSQFVVAKFINSDGREWLKNKAIIFNGFKDLESHFITFFNLLSKNAVTGNLGIYIEEVDTIKGNTIYSTLTKRDSEVVIRNTLSERLLPILDKVFGEVYKYETLDNKQLFEACFVENLDTKKNKTDIEKLFEDRPPELNEVIPAKNVRNISRQIEDEIKGYEAIVSMPAPNPIVIVGSKGSGKTTFIKYLFNFSFSAQTLSKNPNLYLDFREYVDFTINTDREKIFKELLEQLFTKYSDLDLNSTKVLIRIYYKEVKRNDESIWNYLKKNSPGQYQEKLNSFLEENLKQQENHFIKVAEYLLKERRLRLCVTLDNADQLDYNTQREIFLLANSINSRGKCITILSIREGYYYKLRNKPPFDAFRSNVYHITAPPYKEVLQKRITYAIESLKVGGKITGVWGSNKSLQIDAQTGIDFFSNLDKTLFINENSEMLRFLEETTYPNIRLGLELFRDFLLSGHTKVSDYVLRKYIQPDVKIPIPVQEFVISIALENKKYYNHELSRVHNIFYPSEESTYIFLKCKILKYLFEKTKSHGYAERFILVKNLIEDFNSVGYLDRIIFNELNDLKDLGMIETDDQISDIENHQLNSQEQSISISLKGFYYLNELKNRFFYIDLVSQDTPIYDIESFQRVKSEFPLSDDKGQRNLKNRKSCVLAFIEYLKKQEANEKTPQFSYLNGFTSEILQTIKVKDLPKIEGFIKANSKQ
jgi:hypothetical protein